MEPRGEGIRADAMRATTNRNSSPTGDADADGGDPNEAPAVASLLAYEMNGAPLPELHGAPLRLRVENQLGYKMVKWIKSVEFVAGIEQVGKGHGGRNEDDEYYDLVANI
jgi:DMSO/TMAO reductase YedYZ molybdopterin-dependent catalytic subunit